MERVLCSCCNSTRKSIPPPLKKKKITNSVSKTLHKVRLKIERWDVRSSARHQSSFHFSRVQNTVTFTFTYLLHAMWHIRPQHNPANQLCQPLRLCTSLQFFRPAFSLSLSAVFLHVVIGLPCFRRPPGVQVNAVL